MRVYGTSGSYGRIPSPMIAQLRMRADLDYTMNGADVNWDLPSELRPEDASSLLPTANLLNWSPADLITQDQRNIMTRAGIGIDEIRVVDVHGIPINVPV